MEPSAPQPKKGLSGLAIAGIGCGGLTLIALIGAFMLLGRACSKVKEFAGDFQKNPAKATAMLAVKANPDLEVVRTDDSKGQITFRDKKSGEETTLSFDEMSKGGFNMKVKNAKGEETTINAGGSNGQGAVTIKGPDGKMTIGGDAAASAPPAWVPPYPGATIVPGAMRMEKGDSVTGSSVSETKDGVAKIKEFYDAKLKELGYQTESMSMNLDNKENASITGTKEDGKRKLTVTASGEGGKTTVMIVYEGPKN